MTAERVEEILGYGRETLSLETPVGDDGTATFGEFIEDADAPVRRRRRRLRPAAGPAALGARARCRTARPSVMRMRFGLDDGRARTLDEVGKELGLTRERIRQIERDTLSDLRRSRPSGHAEGVAVTLCNPSHSRNCRSGMSPRAGFAGFRDQRVTSAQRTPHPDRGEARSW